MKNTKRIRAYAYDTGEGILIERNATFWEWTDELMKEDGVDELPDEVRKNTYDNVVKRNNITIENPALMVVRFAGETDPDYDMHVWVSLNDINDK